MDGDYFGVFYFPLDKEFVIVGKPSVSGLSGLSLDGINETTRYSCDVVYEDRSYNAILIQLADFEDDLTETLRRVREYKSIKKKSITWILENIPRHHPERRFRFPSLKVDNFLFVYF
jgi:hypothetical protein